MGSRIIQRIKQSRGFCFAVLAVGLVWIVSSMSENRHFRENYHIVYDGIDRSRFAIIQLDSTATLDIVSNGFRAFNRGLKDNHTIHLNVARFIGKDRDSSSDIRFTLNTEEYLDIIRKQIDMRGVTSIAPVSAQLNVHLSPRKSKAFVPDISPVSFQFVDMVGLCGEPVVSPDTVWLYGSQESLDKIDRLMAAHQTIRDIRLSGKYKIRLDTIWQKYKDLHVSTQTVDIYLPVETFIEKKIELPLQLQTGNGLKTKATDRVKMYPANIEVTCIVPSKDYNSISADDFVATATIRSDTSSMLDPVVSSYPANVRIKSVYPEQIQYIVIK